MTLTSPDAYRLKLAAMNAQEFLVEVRRVVRGQQGRRRMSVEYTECWHSSVERGLTAEFMSFRLAAREERAEGANP